MNLYCEKCEVAANLRFGLSTTLLHTVQDATGGAKLLPYSCLTSSSFHWTKKPHKNQIYTSLQEVNEVKVRKHPKTTDMTGTWTNEVFSYQATLKMEKSLNQFDCILSGTFSIKIHGIKI